GARPRAPAPPPPDRPPRLRHHVQRRQRGIPAGPAGRQRPVPHLGGPLREVEDRLPALGQLGDHLHVLRAHAGHKDRDPLPHRVVDQLQRLCPPRAPPPGPPPPRVPSPP